MLNYRQIGSALSKVAKTLDIEKYDVYGVTSKSTKVSVNKGEADSVTAKNTGSCVLRVWQGQKVGTVSTTDLTPEGIEQALIQAKEVADLGLQDVSPDFSPEATTKTDHQADTASLERTPPGTLISELIKMEKKVLDADPRITSVPYNGINESLAFEFYINSEGAEKYCQYTSSSCFLFAMASEEGKRARKAYSVKISTNYPSLETGDCVEETVRNTLFHLDYIPLPSITEDFNIVFSPEAFLSLFGAFSNIWNARSVLDQKSLSKKDSIGKTIAWEHFNFTDDALHENNLSKSLFDQEGTPTRFVNIIENGVLRTFIHNEETARAFKVKPTGHGVIGARPSASNHYFSVYRSGPGGTIRDMHTEKVVYIERVNALHAGVQSLEGSFSLPVDGWVSTDDGKRSFESAVVSGDIIQALKNIVYMDPEPTVTEYGTCPNVWISGLSVTG